jgi:hypothetical protein
MLLGRLSAGMSMTVMFASIMVTSLFAFMLYGSCEISLKARFFETG